MKLGNIITKSLIVKNIQKAEGYYVDNYKNRKLGRVGMSYGRADIENFEEEEDTETDYTYTPKLILKKMSDKLSNSGMSLLKEFFTNDGFNKGDIEWNSDKVYLNTFCEVNPETDKNKINLGERIETKEKELNSYYKFCEERYNKEELDKIIFTNCEIPGKIYTQKNISLLNRLKEEKEGRRRALNSAKENLYYEKYYPKETHLSYDERKQRIGELSDEEADQYLAKRTTKDGKQFYSFYKQQYKKNEKIISWLSSHGVDLEEYDVDQFNDKLKNLITNSPRREFYDVIKQGLANDSYEAKLMLRARFMYRYNKILTGSAWEAKDKNYQYKTSLKDNAIGLCNQLEYAIDDVLKDDKDLFINNPNVKFIQYEEGTRWGGCSYGKENKVITITDEYFENRKRSAKIAKTTLTREKFMVEAFIHELGHSTDISKDIYESELYKDFAHHLGYKKNYLQTIYTNAIKDEKDANLILNSDYYLSIKKDAKQDIINIFEPLYNKYRNKEYDNEFGNKEIGNLFISGYSNKSAGEGYAEYFSFYMGNKAKLDKDIEEYKKNPKEYLRNVNIADWYKYSSYNNKWQFHIDYWKEDEKQARRDYYEAVIKYNIEMLMDVQQIVKDVKRKINKN